MSLCISLKLHELVEFRCIYHVSIDSSYVATFARDEDLRQIAITII